MTGADFPQYRCHKIVRAVKIHSITRDAAGFKIHPENGQTFPIADSYFKKHSPQPGGYFVIYEDGYCSYSPAKVFEAGYTLVERVDLPLKLAGA